MTDDKLPTVEYWVSTPTMNAVRRHRWEPDGDGAVLSTIREWTWNFREGEYNEHSTSMTVEVTPAGIVEHRGQPLEEYARDRVEVLTRKRFRHRPGSEPVVVRTE